MGNGGLLGTAMNMVTGNSHGTHKNGMQNNYSPSGSEYGYPNQQPNSKTHGLMEQVLPAKYEKLAPVIDQLFQGNHKKNGY